MTEIDANDADAFRARALEIVREGLSASAAVGEARQRCENALTELEFYSRPEYRYSSVSERARLTLSDLLTQLARASDRSQTLPRRSRSRLLDWLRGTVGSGVPTTNDPIMRAFLYRSTMLLRFAGAASATLLVLRSHPALALVAAWLSVGVSGLVRYRTNAESGVSFRDRFVSQMLGHLGDALVLSACTWAVFVSGMPDRFGGLLLVGGAASQFAGLVRVGCHEIGLRVGRPRLDRVVRVAAVSFALVGLSATNDHLIALSASLLLVYSAIQIEQIMLVVWNYRAQEVFTVVTVDAAEPADVHAMRAAKPNLTRV